MQDIHCYGNLLDQLWNLLYMQMVLWTYWLIVYVCDL